MSTDANAQLFVYGTLRSGFQHPVYAYISRYFTLVGQAKVKGRLYDMGSFPAAVPVTDDYYIIGELYRINHPDEFAWAVAQLDDYEGLNTEPEEAIMYKREETTVYLPDQTTTAWVYWYNGDVSKGQVVETGDILEYIQQQKNKP